MDFERMTIPHHINIYTTYDVVKYKEVMRNRWDPYKNEPIQQASGLCYVLRRLVNSDESRIYAVLDILEKQDTAIIFYNFDYELDMLRYTFYNLDDGVSEFEVAEWNGHMHQEIPTGKKWVYLVQYTAGCEGWNCIRTNTIIFFSQNYSYKVVTQAAGRIDRLNSPFIDLYYYHLKSRASIDLAISRAFDAKKQFNEGRWVNGKEY
jgi:superfamily II DNA or RNA helicase